MTLNSLANHIGGFIPDISGDIAPNIHADNVLVYAPENPETLKYNVFGVIDKESSDRDKSRMLEELALIFFPDREFKNGSERFFYEGGRDILIAALTAFWGWTGWLAAAWFLAMLLDYATGSAAALRAGTWSSRVAREGLWHKAGAVAGVLVAALLDFALRVLLGSVPGLGIDYDVLLCPLVTAWYLLTELGSIAENAGALGAPMPQFLMRAIAALRAGISDRGGGDGDGGCAA